uniref:Major facilitator superfamily (MFS) profile domain-containing protein n=1 Tax=Crocodylus porosus TaxID=8502 RepID=A0A7M4G2J3_CROPO
MTKLYTFFILCLLSAAFTPVYVGVFFLGFIPEHRCLSPGVAELSSRCGWNLEEELNYTVPKWGIHGESSTSRCRRFDVDWNTTGLSCSNPLENFTSQSRVPLTLCKDGWVYDSPGTSIVTEVRIYILPLTLIIKAKFGRKLCIFVTIIANAISGILVALAPTYLWVMIFRFLQGLVSKGSWTAGYILITEIVGPSYRKTVGILYQVAFTVGLLVLDAVAYIIPHWRWLQLAFTLPGFLFLFNYWCLPESPRWLISQRRNEKAMKIIHSIAQKNGKKLPSLPGSLLREEHCEELRPSPVDLVRTPQMRKHTFILMYNW